MTLPTLSKNSDSSLRKLDRAFVIILIIMFASVVLLTCCSCGSTKQVTQLVRDVRVDTVYLSNIQYDCIYIFHDHVSEHHLGTLPPMTSKGEYLDIPMRTDTLYIKDKSIEYRYKLFRDTIYKVQRDSIPYEVTIIKTKEIARPLTWYAHLSRAILWLNIGFVLLVIVRLIRKLRT